MYLGDIAYLLHVNALQVDSLRLRDFYSYVMWIESYYEAAKQRANQQGG